jgi:DNA-binding protein HU-beta
MNKSQLVDALADRLGDRKIAATAVDALLQIVVDTVRSGDSVSLAGFGVFESRARAARTGRNPRTGESVAVPATTVPAFRPGTGFRNAVAGDGAADVAEPAAEVPPADAPAPPRRRRAASATNGAGGGASLNGAVDLGSVSTATLLAEPPVVVEKAAKAKKPAAKKATEKKPTKKAEPKRDKAGKKSKKGK